MTVLVTGATGSLGHTVVARLLAEGRRVAVLTRRPFRARALFADRVTLHEWHPLSEPVPPAALEGVTGIVHLMGEPLAGAPWQDRAEFVLASRLNAARRLAEALAGRGVRVVAVSLAVGGRDAGDPITEAAPRSAAPDAIERDVLAWEAEIMAVGDRVANVRLGLLAVPGAPLAQLVALAQMGAVPDLRGMLVPAIDVADAAAMLSGLLSRPDLTGVIFGVAPEPVKGEDLGRLLAKAARFPLPVQLPKAILRRRLGHINALIDGRRRIVPQRLTDLGAEFTVPDPLPSLERAVADLLAPERQPLPLVQRLRALLPAKPAKSA